MSPPEMQGGVVKKKKVPGKKDSECCRPFLLLQFERREVEHLRGVRRCHSCLRLFPLQMTHNAHAPQEPAFRISINLFFFLAKTVKQNVNQ